MKGKILLFSLLAFFSVGELNRVVGAELLIREDFEAGQNWNYTANFDLWDTLSSKWDIVVTAPHGGSYCAQSQTPTGFLANNSSAFYFSISANEVFIKFWAKFPLDVNSGNAGTNFFRYGTGAGVWVNGGEYDIQDNWLFIYSDKVRSPTINLTTDNTWHEYSFYMNFSTGVWRSWKDAAGDYTIVNAVDNFTDVTYAVPFTTILFPWYFKDNPINSLWWIDDIEVWDGMPVVGSDIIPPGDVTNFSAQPGDSQIALSWTNPTDSDFSGTLIRYFTGTDPYPATHTEGFFVANRPGTPASNDSFTVTGLENGVQYNFSAFTYDDAGNYSPAYVSATPRAAGSGTEPLTAPKDFQQVPSQ